MKERDKNGDRTVRRVELSLGVVVGLVVLVTCLHYTTPTRYHNLHELYRRLYYLPIIIAAFRYSIHGGIATSVAVSLIYLPHVVFQWEGNFLDNLVRFNEIVLYLVVGGTAGLLSRRVQDERDRYKRTAEELETSYHKLEAQTLQLSEMESQLRAADRLAVLGELSASMAHEVRNPLGSIRGAVDILRKRCPKDKTAQEFSDLLSREVDRLNRVVENYLEMGRKPSGYNERSNLEKTIESVLNLVGPEIRRKQVEVRCDFPDYPLIAPMQEIEVQQVFLNLVLNALPVLKEGDHIHIQGGVIGEKIFIRITDTGRGIPPDQLKEIFQPFYTSRKHGTGLGLAIVKRIMESYGGKVEVESEENKGTTFMLLFQQTE